MQIPACGWLGFTYPILVTIGDGNVLLFTYHEDWAGYGKGLLVDIGGGEESQNMVEVVFFHLVQPGGQGAEAIHRGREG